MKEIGKVENITEIFRALSCKTRYKIMKFLSEGEKTVGTIVKKFNFTEPTISHHLKVLTNVGLVVKKQYRQFVIYTVNTKLWKYIEKITKKV